MKPEDEYGHKLNSNLYKRMLTYGTSFIDQGYVESKYEPNLFYKTVKHKLGEIKYVIDIIIVNPRRSLCDNMTVKFFIEFPDNISSWLQRHIFEKELKRLKVNKILNKKDRISIEDTCEVCRKKLTSDNKIKHHLNYKECRTMFICRSCHAKIHHSISYSDLKPMDKRPIKERKTREGRCSNCGGFIRIPFDTPEKYNFLCSCKKSKNTQQCPVRKLQETIKLPLHKILTGHY